MSAFMKVLADLGKSKISQPCPGANNVSLREIISATSIGLICDVDLYKEIVKYDA